MGARISGCNGIAYVQSEGRDLSDAIQVHRMRGFRVEVKAESKYGFTAKTIFMGSCMHSS